MNKDNQKRIERKSFSSYLLLWLKGFCMGASDVVPGVSGGTMAFILGIYQELIDAIRSFDIKALHLLVTLKIRPFLDYVAWPFLLALGIGILSAVFSMARILGWLLENKPVLVWSFFLGLIFASALSVSSRVEKWRPSNWLSLCGGTLGAYFLVGLVPVSTPDSTWFLFVCGAVAICAMILPGISGSFILVLLGKYKFVLDAVNSRDIYVLLVFATGAFVGIVSFARLLGWLLKKHHDFIIAGLTGLMLGSVRKVWPWKKTVESMADMHGRVIPLIQVNILPDQWSIEVIAALTLMATGFLTVIVLDRISKARN